MPTTHYSSECLPSSVSLRALPYYTPTPHMSLWASSCYRLACSDTARWLPAALTDAIAFDSSADRPGLQSGGSRLRLPRRTTATSWSYSTALACDDCQVCAASKGWARAQARAAREKSRQTHYNAFDKGVPRPGLERRDLIRRGCRGLAGGEQWHCHSDLGKREARGGVGSNARRHDGGLLPPDVL